VEGMTFTDLAEAPGWGVCGARAIP